MDGGSAGRSGRLLRRFGVAAALGLTCLSNVWHDAQRVSLGYILIEFGDFIGKMLVKQERAVEDKEQEE